MENRKGGASAQKNLGLQVYSQQKLGRNGLTRPPLASASSLAFEHASSQSHEYITSGP